MKFVLVNGRTPRRQSFCALCCAPIGECYLREIGAQLAYCDHECYVNHCDGPALALQYHPIASQYLRLIERSPAIGSQQ
jgi:hypothetical protein